MYLFFPSVTVDHHRGIFVSPHEGLVPVTVYHDGGGVTVSPYEVLFPLIAVFHSRGVTAFRHEGGVSVPVYHGGFNAVSPH